MAFSDFSRTVANLMRSYGAPVTVVITGEGVYDPATSTVTASETTHTPQGMVFDFTLQSNGNQTQPGSLIEAGDKQVILQPLAGMAMPKSEKDWVVLGGDRYRIVTVKELNPAGSGALFYELLVRK